jgi:hypothetical protein
LIRLPITPPSKRSEILELVGIGQDVPERLARRRNVAGERWISVLQERQHLQDEQIERLPQSRQHGLITLLMKLTELGQQVVDLVLERQLGEDSNRLGVAQALLESGQVEGRCRLFRGLWCRSFRWRRGLR